MPPPFAGFQPDECYYVGSLGKIAAMYAAFELRFRVRRLMFAARIANSTVTPQAVFHVIGDVWGPQICRTFPDFPALDVRYPGRFPQLNTMFTVAADGTVSFRQGTATDNDIKEVKDGALRQNMTFADWMKSMIFWSNNSAAGRVIATMGYPYVNWLLRRACFFHPDTKLGLWLSQNYADAGWKPNADLMTLTPRGKTHYKATSNITGTCREITRLLTLAALGKLFEGPDAVAACDEMILLMRKLNDDASAGPLGGGDRSPIGEAVGLAGTDTVRLEDRPRRPAGPAEPAGPVGPGRPARLRDHRPHRGREVVPLRRRRRRRLQRRRGERRGVRRHRSRARRQHPGDAPPMSGLGQPSIPDLDNSRS